MDLTLKAYAFEVVAGQPVKWSSTEPGHAMIPDHDGVTLIPKVLALQLTTNRGAVFGLGQGGRWIFVGISVVAVIFIVSLFWRSRARAYGWHAAMGLIFAGAISNLYLEAQPPLDLKPPNVIPAAVGRIGGSTPVGEVVVRVRPMLPPETARRASRRRRRARGLGARIRRRGR